MKRAGPWRGSLRRACCSGRRRGGVLQLGEEALDKISFAIEAFAEARLPAPVALRRDVGRCAPLLEQFADAVGVVSLIGQHDGARPEMVEQRICDLPVMRLSGSQAEPDREAPRVDDDVALGRDAAA